MSLVHHFGVKKRKSFKSLLNPKQSQCGRNKNHRYGSGSKNKPNFGLDFSNGNTAKNMEILSFI
jgi:hypothetical protein